ncbi:MAG TPA: glycine cleavage system protein GcvH [Chromatiaceae bacterium]|jgi:glycine cleavage system H protein|nr:glycine cleavage system protein GcvH [Chromatiaceae bacterium]HIA07857.1 glycine cleavage system protein GcvH [Chromatiaceae bacterium]HIB84451.1 glycine cleavage system protein GcvH [Chromatiaceae bacterium]HIN81742.1 glycine cleavage system protein GcvH [Chromatiales bacterium]HIO54014.1 glycine cleavage system protein GcvH [Chromatiales bacterium]
MSDIPADLRYTKSHEWVRTEEDGSLTIGITAHAQELLGDLVFVETPEIGAVFAPGDDCTVVESVKAASDVYCPVSGEVTEINEALEDSPQIINEDAYGAGWLFKLQPSDAPEMDELMDADAYQAHVDEEDH